ncbi:unnamed protein product [Cuscuta epithymum]|uniref:Uncharacterized protein n=1 Tax=Cuscuta epithymum TaxID=186058 RepID=A0AAV0G8R0_9ASTE|nr:unnamed protein product [Cuscuta epithymum]
MDVEGNHSNSYGQPTIVTGGRFFETLISEVSSRSKSPSNYCFERTSRTSPRMLNVNAHLVYNNNNNETNNMLQSKLSPGPQPGGNGANNYVFNHAHLLLPNRPLSQIHGQGYKRHQSHPVVNIDVYGTNGLKRPRLDANMKLQYEKSLMELQEKNIELKTLIEQQRQQSHIHKHVSPLGLEEQVSVQAELEFQDRAQVSSPPYFDGNICSRRLMQYIYHLSCRPFDNDINFWRKFCSEYYAPCAKQRWCLSICENMNQEALNLFTKTAMVSPCRLRIPLKESWCCSICCSKSPKGFEVIYEALPSLFKAKFESGMVDEIMFLGLPEEHIFPSGLIMLEYGRVVQESIYENFRIVHEGKLRVIFRDDLKIVLWEFCVLCHEEFLERRLISRQVNGFVEAAQIYSSIENFEDMKSCCNMFLKAEDKLERNMQMPLVNDLGFSKQHFRCLQIAEVVGTMKDLITISQVLGIGPIECLNKYGKLKEVKEPKTADSVVTTRDEEQEVGETVDKLEAFAKGTAASRFLKDF